LRSEEETDWIAEAIDEITDRIARRRRTPIRPHHVRSFGNTPDKHCLTKIAGLLGDPLTAREINQTTEAKCRVHGETRSRFASSFEAALQQIVHEDSRLFQV